MTWFWNITVLLLSCVLAMFIYHTLGSKMHVTLLMMLVVKEVIQNGMDGVYLYPDITNNQ